MKGLSYSAIFPQPFCNLE